MYTLLYFTWITSGYISVDNSTGILLVLSGSLGGRGVWGRKVTCVCMAEPLHWLPETITLLIGYCCLVAKSCPTL